MPTTIKREQEVQAQGQNNQKRVLSFSRASIQGLK